MGQWVTGHYREPSIASRGEKKNKITRIKVIRTSNFDLCTWCHAVAYPEMSFWGINLTKF